MGVHAKQRLWFQQVRCFHLFNDGVYIFFGIILEAVTYQLVSIWFAIGALGGMIAAFLGTNFYVQMAVFIVVSFICILCLRPLSMKFFKPRNVETNAQSLVVKKF